MAGGPVRAVDTIGHFTRMVLGQPEGFDSLVAGQVGQLLFAVPHVDLHLGLQQTDQYVPVDSDVEVQRPAHPDPVALLQGPQDLLADVQRVSALCCNGRASTPRTMTFTEAQLKVSLWPVQEALPTLKSSPRYSFASGPYTMRSMLTVFSSPGSWYSR